MSVKPWNVLGVSVASSTAVQSTNAAAEPDETMIFVASASLRELRNPNPPLGQLGGLVGDVSRCVGIGEDANFPDDVVAKIQAEGQAMYHRYGYPKSKHVIHVAAVSFGAEASSQPRQRRLGLQVRSMHRIDASGALLCLCSGSVTDFEGDAIVNAANEGCIQGAGVDDAINVAGGRALRDARLALPVVQGAKRRDGGPTDVRCPMGEVRVTPGGDLKAGWCIHAVGPNYNVETKLGVTVEEVDKLVATTYRRAMEAAQEKKLSSVAFCLISGGMFRGKQSLDRVLQMGLSGIRDGAYSGLKEVHLVAFTAEEEEALSKACSVVLPGSEQVMDGQGVPEMSQAAAVEKLASAYCNVFDQAAQVEKEVLRLSAISSSGHAAHLRSVLPEITAAAIARAVKQSPPSVIGKLSRNVELCVDNSSEVIRYERALKEHRCTA